MKRKRQLVHPDTVVLIRQILIGLMIFSLLALLITGIWYGTRMTAFTIDTVHITGGETISHEEVEALVRQELSGAYLRLIPYTFAYTYPHQAIVSAVSEIERIKDVTVERVGPTKLWVTFNEYVANALWCEENTDTCVFLDEVGYAFAQTPRLEGGSFVRFGTPGRVPERGVSVTTPENYHTALALVAALEDMEWYVERVDIDAASDAYFLLTEGGELKISLLEAPDAVIDNLRTVLASERFVELAPGNFQYIDLRFGNKVFVNNTEVESATSTELAAETVFATSSSAVSEETELTQTEESETVSLTAASSTEAE